jgi:hypothetical protein
MVLFGVFYDTVIDRFPGLRGQCFDVFTQYRFFNTLISNANKAKLLQTYRVYNMKSEVMIAEPKHLLDDACSNNLLGTHPVGSRSTGGPWGKILHRQIANGRTSLQDAVDGIEFNGPWMGTS